jgi:hypothetical protein
MRPVLRLSTSAAHGTPLQVPHRGAQRGPQPTAPDVFPNQTAAVAPPPGPLQDPTEKNGVDKRSKITKYQNKAISSNSKITLTSTSPKPLQLQLNLPHTHQVHSKYADRSTNVLYLPLFPNTPPTSSYPFISLPSRSVTYLI